MKWNNLKLYLCPVCGRSLEDRFNNIDMYVCICGFRITSIRFQQLFNSRMHKNHYRPDDEVPELF